jgi:predicted dithiol-disulfide oxidoreductase (DUF899 family)
MNYQNTAQQLEDYRRQIASLRKKMREAQSAVVPEPVQDYEFATADGKVRLSALFGGKRDLFMIHNMGSSCPIYPHLADRAAFVVSSPDSPEKQQAFAASRGWRFPMVSHEGSSFAADMGYRGKNGGWRPGVSVFKRDGTRIVRVSDTGFSPGDDFCGLWHFFDLLPEGRGDWQPQYRYD